MKKYIAMIFLYVMLSSCDSKVAPSGTSSNTDSVNSAISQAIDNIIDTSWIKDELETTVEFNERIKKELEKHSNKSYKVKLKSKDIPNYPHKFLTYNADTSILTLSLPDIESKLLYVEDNGKRELISIPASYIETDTLKDRATREIEAVGGSTSEDYDLDIYGIAILGQNSQGFSAKITRDKVSNFLDDGVIVLNVKPDLHYYTDDRHLGMVKPQIVFTNEREKPTIEGRYIEEFWLPVRLISVEVYNGKRDIVLRGQGTEINTTAFDK